MCVCVREREYISVCVYVCDGEGVRGSACVCVCVWISRVLHVSACTALCPRRTRGTNTGDNRRRLLQVKNKFFLSFCIFISKKLFRPALQQIQIRGPKHLKGGGGLKYFFSLMCVGGG
jgi:hypothetical protein